MRRVLMTSVLSLVATALCLPSLAEVRVIQDKRGGYLTTRVLTVGRAGMVWSPVRRADPVTALNPLGDRNGDQWPSIEESPVAPYYPWVVWSRRNRSELDLGWSRWTGTRWQAIGTISADGDREGDDLDPELAFSIDGRPHIVWWHEANGVGRVYMTLYLVSTWMPAYLVSDPSVDSRHPSIEVLGDSAARVRYLVPGGSVVEQIVTFNGGVTITDDIDPLDFVSTDTPVPLGN